MGKLGYLFVYGFLRCISLLPFFILYPLASVVAFKLNHLFGYRRKVIEGNLKRAFPEASAEQIKKWKAAFYKNMADIMLETIKSLHISEKSIRKRVVLENPELFQEHHKNGKGVMVVMGHYANFEWVAMAFSLLVPQKCFAVYGRIKNERFNRLIVRIRERFGLSLFLMRDTYDFMLNNPTKAPLYLFMADQAPHKGKIKHRAPFFSIDTPTHLGAENLAVKCDLAIVFIDVKRAKRGHYSIRARNLYTEPQGKEKGVITNTHVAALESLIRSYPPDWLWSHKRWKNG